MELRPSGRRLAHEHRYPLLNSQDYAVTSEASDEYNCAAWVVNNTESRWWPLPNDDDETYYWPEGARRDDSLEAFVEGFGTLGYTPCDDDSLEQGFEKIAVYATVSDSPQHVAKQLEDGRWTSKLGGGEDITHNDLLGLSGGSYGYPKLFMKRLRGT